MAGPYAATMVAISLVAVCSAVEGVVVHTAGGSIEGLVVTVGSNATAPNQAVLFLGIPYARPPVEDLRWRPPVEPLPWQGVRASKFQCNCAQPHQDRYDPTSEDCLYLNVFTPNTVSKTGARATMVYFYGGSWLSGGSALPEYDGRYDEVLAQDVVLVTVNYRLGAFGWLGSPALANRSKHGSFGNYGQQDQQAALRWVQRNIAAFGGNPANITIYGESAGAGSVSTHLVMPSSKGLFQAGIMESGSMSYWVGMTAADAQQRFDQVLALTNCTTVACLLHVDTATLQYISGSVVLPAIQGCLQVPTRWGPVVDGVELLDMPCRLAAQGKIASRVPVLLGSNRNEGTMFPGVGLSATAKDVESLVQFIYGDTVAASVLDMYPVGSYSSPFQQAAAIETDSTFGCYVRRTARWLLAAGAPSVHVYYFTHAPYFIDNTQPWMGATHTSEIPFVFVDPTLLHGGAELKLGRQVATYWTNFAAAHTPNGDGSGHTRAGDPLPQWPDYSLSSAVVLDLDLTISRRTNLKETECNAWDLIYKKVDSP